MQARVGICAHTDKSTSLDLLMLLLTRGHDKTVPTLQ